MNGVQTHQIYRQPLRPATHSPGKKENDLFKNVLAGEYDQCPVKLTKHAKQRLEERDIQLSHGKWEMIHQKMSEAKQKGITDSLVLTKEAALVVNADQNTVITAMNRKEARSHIFTNINGTILLDD